MKVFLSWSGELSKAYSVAFQEWLRYFFTGSTFFMSDVDIQYGARGLLEIATELENSSLGIVFVTKANSSQPWINYEAGSLAKVVNHSRVTPFLIDLRREELAGPLSQFQSALNDKPSVRKLIDSLAKSHEVPIAENQVNTMFDRFWPDLESKLRVADEAYVPQAELLDLPEGDQHIAEILELTRSHSRKIDEMMREMGLFGPESSQTGSYSLIPTEFLGIVSQRFLEDQAIRRALVLSFNEYEARAEESGLAITVESFRNWIIHTGLKDDRNSAQLLRRVIELPKRNSTDSD